MRAFYHAGDPIQAAILKGYLEQEGFEVLVQGNYLSGAIGELPADGIVRLWIDDANFDAVREAVRRWELA